jgi:hypothetical protein
MAAGTSWIRLSVRDPRMTSMSINSSRLRDTRSSGAMDASARRGKQESRTTAKKVERIA